VKVQDFKTTPLWLETPTGFIAVSWHSRSAEVLRGSLAVVIVPGVGLEERTLSVSVSPLVKTLIDLGIPSLVVNVEGTANSSSTMQDHKVADAWVGDVRVALEHVRGLGFERVVVVAIRLAALIALNAVRPDEVDAMVLWAPVLNGRRFVRESTLLAESSETGTSGSESDSVLIGSFEIHRVVLDSIKLLKVPLSARDDTAKVLIVDDPDRLDTASLPALGSPAIHVGPETSRWIHGSSDQARFPERDVGYIARWIFELSKRWAHVEAPVPAAATHSFVHNETRIVEQFVRFDDGDIVGVLAHQGDSPSRPPALAIAIALSPQPGRSLIELARDEAANGHPTLRFEHTSNGLSSRRASQGWGELYSSSNGSEMTAALQWLETRGEVETIAIGFCAGAIAALSAGPVSSLRAVVAINPALFVPGPSWRTFDGVNGGRWRKFIDKVDHRNFAARFRWHYRVELRKSSRSYRSLVGLSSRNVGVLLQYGASDIGLAHFLRSRNRTFTTKRSADAVRIAQYPNLGHSLTGLDSRARLFRDLREFIDQISVR
jgi:hypothetical protein